MHGRGQDGPEESGRKVKWEMQGRGTKWRCSVSSYTHGPDARRQSSNDEDLHGIFADLKQKRGCGMKGTPTFTLLDNVT